jgi:hypothetical protein
VLFQILKKTNDGRRKEIRRSKDHRYSLQGGGIRIQLTIIKILK